MKRKIAYLDKPQAKAVVQIFRRGQLGDLAVFLKVDSKHKNGQYKLCLDCPTDTPPTTGKQAPGRSGYVSRNTQASNRIYVVGRIR